MSDRVPSTHCQLAFNHELKDFSSLMRSQAGAEPARWIMEAAGIVNGGTKETTAVYLDNVCFSNCQKACQEDSRSKNYDQATCNFGDISPRIFKRVSMNEGSCVAQYNDAAQPPLRQVSDQNLCFLVKAFHILVSVLLKGIFQTFPTTFPLP